MKKILLSAVALLSITATTAQIYTANDSASFSNWNSIDLDGDGNGWGFFDASTFATPNNISPQGEVAYSASYDNTTGALTPNNLFVSPAIDLSGAVGASLEFKVGASETTNNWWKEHYAVYITADAAAFATAAASGTFPTPEVEETLGQGDTMYTRTIDLTAFAGQSSVYIVIRHFNCTDKWRLYFDDVIVTGDFASVEENSLKVLSAYPNPANDVLNISLSNNASSVSIISLDGKVVYTESVNSNNIALNVADLTPGIYFYQVTTAEGEKITNKFVKQ